MRKMHKDFELNQCLADSDSSFDEYSSVASDRIGDYEKQYRELLCDSDGTKRKVRTFKLQNKLKVDYSKDSRAFKSTCAGTNSTASKSSFAPQTGQARFIYQSPDTQ